ncbi:site-specific integrase [Dysgonomonas sp. 511]|uniref:tyrosine-type recombinase/integrase n=1 Tax=Dysgonomonas sp. 511 TaxID=2302930 RepID=UPI0013CF9F6D|nr:site-specific integrase [Dysgonomonas sp. 511]NDV80101.1 hypothetical protein [Dysgonomonas sp. 511]
MKYSPTASIRLDKRKAIGDKQKAKIGKSDIEENLYPLKIRITCARESRFYLLSKDFYLSESEFEDLFTKRKPEILNARREAEKKLNEAKSIIDQIEDNFSFDEFNRIYHSNTKSTKDVYSIYEEFIQIKRDEKKYGTVKSYTDALNHLKRYKTKLYFRDITPDFLRKYVKNAFTEGSGTIGIYLRPLRAVYNYAIDVKKVARRDDFPFGKNKFVIPTAQSRNLVLPIEQMQALFKYQQEHFQDKVTADLLALDLFIFSYLCHGMNFIDILNLKIGNRFIDDIGDEYIHFVRAKTERTKNNPESTPVYLNDAIKEILDRHANKSQNPNDYLFPIYEKIQDVEERYEKIKEYQRRVNKSLKRIAGKFGIEKLSTYWTRHSFATHTRMYGYSYDDIRDMLSQKTTTITQGYVHKNEKFPVFKEVSTMLLANMTNKDE